MKNSKPDREPIERSWDRGDMMWSIKTSSEPVGSMGVTFYRHLQPVFGYLGHKTGNRVKLTWLCPKIFPKNSSPSSKVVLLLRLRV